MAAKKKKSKKKSAKKGNKRPSMGAGLAEQGARVKEGAIESSIARHNRLRKEMGMPPLKQKPKKVKKPLW